MRIITDRSKWIPPYSVVLIDTLDSYYYADIFDDDKMKVVARLDNFDKAKAAADAIFVNHNLKWKSLSEMNELDAGYDVRIYDSNYACVYASHQKFAKKWIWE